MSPGGETEDAFVSQAGGINPANKAATSGSSMNHGARHGFKSRLLQKFQSYLAKRIGRGRKEMGYQLHLSTAELSSPAVQFKTMSHKVKNFMGFTTLNTAIVAIESVRHGNTLATDEMPEEYSHFKQDLPMEGHEDFDAQNPTTDSILNETVIRPLRMNPVTSEEELKELDVTDEYSNTSHIDEPLERSESPPMYIMSTVATVDEDEERGSSRGSTIYSRKEADDRSSTTSVSISSLPLFTPLGLSVAWRGLGLSLDVESLVPRSPYRMGRERRYGWIEGQPFHV
ncbi:hypothetical protein PAAG_07630 [Paracoccidioides lutzii Pb01]|uniref:Uncharacterized protein n=1 Tax=Paracoccidioides lutzii (strain ATCC MYA-826 / Pb01) TaxID=502779 RepID=C1HAH6_PARBA|nr:hypothetical protein PAAG_07630 [Paracoccidioides lutzii Pb01]EEH37349.1 hypothetical protein PAAG_07630 [Paracoccidioides lutzii Pb01]